jgi:hypothetical protein
VAIADERYVVLTTRSPSGESVTTRARLVALSDGRLGLWAADDVVTDGQEVQVRVERPDSPELAGTVDVVRSGRSFDEARAKMRSKYGWRARLPGHDAVILFRPEAG